MTDRNAEIKSERRRRDYSGARPRRLHVEEAALDRNKFEYRWTNDTPGNVQRRVDQDWELVSEQNEPVRGGSKNPSMGSSVAAHVGVAPTGGGMQAKLMRKPKQFAEEDTGRRQAAIDKREDAMNYGDDVDHKAEVERSGSRAA